MSRSITAVVPPHSSRRASPDIVPGLLLGLPAAVLMLIFLIGPFLGGIGYSFTNQRLISANPTEPIFDTSTRSNIT
jgi:multiple sugar transport system permease protein